MMYIESIADIDIKKTDGGEIIGSEMPSETEFYSQLFALFETCFIFKSNLLIHLSHVFWAAC